jgi:xanthine dehydrogenase small subunit
MQSGSSRNHILFLLGNERQEIRDIDPTMTVLDWLRLARRMNGTKEGCAEGDCGACTVVIGRPDGNRVSYEPVNACIRFMPTLDGCHVLTVEHLRRPDGRLHPVQQAMVECHGSQCGFCTPGFVMSLLALYLNEERPDNDRIRDALAGNLCRCTGYAPIIAAAKRMFALKDEAENPSPLPLSVEANELVRLGETASDTIVLAFGERRFIAPATSDALATILLETPQAVIVAGATDVGLWVTKQLRVLGDVVYIGRIQEMRRITETPEAIAIGAGATFEDALPILGRHYPDLGELIRRVGGWQVRTVGTIGGNIANGSPIGDSPPALIAIGATLVLRRGKERRSLPLEDYFIDYGKQDRRPGEFIETILVPKPRQGIDFRAYKISKRFDQDISALCGAFLIERTDGVVTAARIAFGGMAGTPKRAQLAETALIGQPWTAATITAAMDALCQDFQPLTDWRASARYRTKVAANLLMKFYLESLADGPETRLVGAQRVRHA